MSDFYESSRLKRNIVRDFFRELNSEKSFLEALYCFSEINGAVYSLLEGVTSFPRMPNNFLMEIDIISEDGAAKIINFQSEKSNVFSDIVAKSKEGKYKPDLLEFSSMMWLLMDDQNIHELLKILPVEDKLMMIFNLINLDIDLLKDTSIKNALISYRKSLEGVQLPDNDIECLDDYRKFL